LITDFVRQTGLIDKKMGKFVKGKESEKGTNGRHVKIRIILAEMLFVFIENILPKTQNSSEN